MTTKTVWLIDSSIYVFRAWHVKPEALNKKGHPIEAVLGFLEFVFNLLSQESPKHIGFAFDESLGNNFRKKIYPEYKANRSPAPESLKRQFQYCRTFLSAFGLYNEASTSYEADDLIGSWSYSLHEDQSKVIFVTADKDLTQLVRNNDLWWDYAKKPALNYHSIQKKFGIPPELISSQLAIAGDKADNIPGVPGVGMATAAKLLTKYPSIEALIKNLNDIHLMKFRGAARTESLISEHQENIKLSKLLTDIKCDIPSTNNVDFKLSPIDKVSLQKVFETLDFTSNQKNKWLNLYKVLATNAPHR